MYARTWLWLGGAALSLAVGAGIGLASGLGAGAALGAAALPAALAVAAVLAAENRRKAEHDTLLQAFAVLASGHGRIPDATPAALTEALTALAEATRTTQGFLTGMPERIKRRAGGEGRAGPYLPFQMNAAVAEGGFQHL